MKRTAKKKEAVIAPEPMRAAAAPAGGELQLPTLIEQAPVAISISRNGVGVYANRKLVQILGLRAAREWIGRPVLEFFAPQFREDSRERTRRRALGLPVPTEFESVGLRTDGTQFPVHVAVAQVALDDGVANIAFITEITERRQAEEKLKENEAKLRAMFEGSSLPMGLAKDGIHIMVNPAYLELFGYSDTSEVVGNPLVNDIAPEERSRIQEHTRRRSIGEFVPASYESRGFKRDGTVFDMAIAASTYELADGVYTIAILRDITKRKLAETKVREQAALLDNATDAICVMSLDSTIRYWNHGCERTFGWTRAKALDRKATDLIPGALACMQALSAALLDQGTWAGEWRHVTGSGGIVEVFSRLTLMRDDQGRPQSVFAINTDITEKKHIEAQFLRAQRLESIGALASGIAHDLNNVLTPILLGAPLLDGAIHDEGARSLLKMMESNAQRGAGIIKQVLTFARGVEGERSPLQARHVIGEIIRLAAETFPKGIRVESSVPADLWPILGDATQLHQALLNLCLNARDAMPGGGVLTLKAANVVVSGEEAAKNAGVRPGSFARLSVSDTGTGIPPEIEARIFEPFFTTKGSGKGTGLGLSTVLGIVRGHGGFVRLTSRVGEGSTFELYLPATETEQAAASGSSGMPWPHAHGECILVVDDEGAVREVARQALIEFGYQVITARRGAEALRIFEERRQEIQLVLTDMMMPEMDGTTLVAALRVLDPAVRIVGITGMSDMAGMSAMKALALAATLPKPFTIEKLLTVTREALL